MNEDSIEDFHGLETTIKELVNFFISDIKDKIEKSVTELERNLSTLREDICEIFETNLDLGEGDHNYIF